MANYTDSWKGIIERMRAFCDGHYLFIADANGNKPFTHGQPDITVDKLNKNPQFPLMHVTPTGRSWNRAEGYRFFSMEIMFADLPFSEGDTSQPKQEHVNEVLSDTARLCEDLIATMVNAGAPFERGVFHFSGDITAEPFIDESFNMLSGHILSLTISVPYNWDACDVPGSFNLSAGSSGGGGNSSAQYWKTFAVSGQDDVDATEAADTVNLVGSGVTITTNATTKTITFTVPTYATVQSVTAEATARAAADAVLTAAITASKKTQWNGGQSGDTVAGSTTSFMSVMSQTAGDNAGETIRQSIAPFAVTMTKIQVAIRTTQSVGGSLVFTLRDDVADTSLVLTIAAGSVAGVYSATGSVAIAAGSLVCCKVTNNAAGASAGISDICISGLITE